MEPQPNFFFLSKDVEEIYFQKFFFDLSLNLYIYS